MQNEWKPIKELVHYSHCEVLAWDGKYIHLLAPVFLNEDGWKCGFTHWMPLPDPPKKPITITKEQRSVVFGSFMRIAKWISDPNNSKNPSTLSVVIGKELDAITE